MKALPKEFHFKCDEHSAEQCEKLGIYLNCYSVQNIGEYYFVENNCIVYCLGEDGRRETIPLISLADYIESEEEKIERLLNEAILSMPREELNKIADELVEKHYCVITQEDRIYPNEIIEVLTDVAVRSAIQSVNHTIEVLEKVIQHDKLRYGITCRGASIELDEQLELKKILEGRL